MAERDTGIPVRTAGRCWTAQCRPQTPRAPQEASRYVSPDIGSVTRNWRGREKEHYSESWIFFKTIKIWQVAGAHFPLLKFCEWHWAHVLFVFSSVVFPDGFSSFSLLFGLYVFNGFLSDFSEKDAEDKEEKDTKDEKPEKDEGGEEKETDGSKTEEPKEEKDKEDSETKSTEEKMETEEAGETADGDTKATTKEELPEIINVSQSLKNYTYYTKVTKPYCRLDNLLEKREKQYEIELKQKLAVEQIIARYKKQEEERKKLLAATQQAKGTAGLMGQCHAAESELSLIRVKVAKEHQFTQQSKW